MAELNWIAVEYENTTKLRVTIRRVARELWVASFGVSTIASGRTLNEAKRAAEKWNDENWQRIAGGTR